MQNDVLKILITEEEIKAKVKEMGKQISKDYAQKNLMLISVFLADLMREITVHAEIDFMAVSSYGRSTKTSGIVRIIKDLDINLEGYDVLIVEDILDSGTTLNYLTKVLKTRNPMSLKIATLLNKPERRVKNIQPDYCGFNIPDEFVIGYGLDYAEKYRNLPYIGVLKKEVYEK